MKIKYCNKRGYPSRKIAKEYLKLSKRAGATVREVYHCDKCDCWHLTSQDPKYSRDLSRKLKNK